MDDSDGEASGDVDLNSEDSDAEGSDGSEGADPDDFSEEERGGEPEQGTAEGTDSEDGGSEESGEEGGEEGDDEERHRRMLEAVTAGGRENKGKGKKGQVVLSEAVPESEFSLNPGSAGGARGRLFFSL